MHKNNNNKQIVINNIKQYLCTSGVIVAHDPVEIGEKERNLSSVPEGIRKDALIK